MGLGQLALARGKADDPLPLLHQARQGFVALRLELWVAKVDESLALAESRTFELDDLIDMVRSARQGDAESGRKAWEICDVLARGSDVALATLGKSLRQVLSGDALDSALAELPDDLRDLILERLK